MGILIQGNGILTLVLPTDPFILFVTMVSETWQLPVWFERVSGVILGDEQAYTNKGFLYILY